MEIEKKRVQIHNSSGLTDISIRICDVIKVGKVLYIEFKRNKKFCHMRLDDFLAEIARAKKILKNA